MVVINCFIISVYWVVKSATEVMAAGVPDICNQRVVIAYPQNQRGGIELMCPLELRKLHALLDPRESSTR